MVVFCFVCFLFCLFFQYFDIRFVLLYDVTLCRRARDLPGLPDMSRCQNNFCNKNQKLTMLCCTQPQSRAQTCLPFRSTAIVDAIGGENSACHNFRGMYFLIPPFGNGQTSKSPMIANNCKRPYTPLSNRRFEHTDLTKCRGRIC